MPACRLSPEVAPDRLVQIRCRNTAIAGRFRLVVESGSDGWRVEVIENGNEIYEAQRCSLAAARRAAVEFVSLYGPGSTGNPISWIESW